MQRRKRRAPGRDAPFCVIQPGLEAEFAGALEVTQRAVGDRSVALERHDALVDGVQNPTGLREVFLLVLGGGADPVVGADDGGRGIQIVEGALH